LTTRTCHDTYEHNWFHVSCGSAVRVACQAFPGFLITAHPVSVPAVIGVWKKNKTKNRCVLCSISLFFVYMCVRMPQTHGRRSASAKHFRASLLLHTTCVRSCCNWRAICVAAKPLKRKSLQVQGTVPGRVVKVP